MALAVGDVDDAQVDGEAAMLRDDVRGGAAGDHADRRRHAAGIVGHRLDGEDLARRLADGAAPVGVARARMRRPALDMHLEAADALARR